MAVPGFSVTDLIQAVGQVKVVYDAFFNQYTSSALQLRDLADDIEQFRIHLQKHQTILEAQGLEFLADEAVRRTLDQCVIFVEDYKEVLDPRRRRTVMGALKTARFPYENREIERLRAQIARHQSNILQFSMNIVLGRSFRTSENHTSSLASASAELTASHSGHPHHSASELLARPVPRKWAPLQPAELDNDNRTFAELPSPLVQGNNYVSSSAPAAVELYADDLFRRPSELLAPVIGERTSAELCDDAPFSTRSELPGSSALSYRTKDSIGSSSPVTIRGSLRPASTTGTIPDLVLPQPALPYCVAELYFGTKKVDLKRKPVGRNCDGGREILILDQDGNLRFRHKIKLSRGELCYPYTWHRRWHKDHSPREIGFKGSSPEAHSVSFKGMTPIKAIPKYIFTTEEDFWDFQGQVRGKRLEGTFDVRRIESAISSKNGEATDQHLKIWRDHMSQDCTISFYASAIAKPRDFEFPIAWFDQDLHATGPNIRLNFIGIESKLSRSFSKTFSRSLTEKSSSSATTTPRIFSPTITGFGSTASSVTTAPSRTSVVSLENEESPHRRRSSRPEQTTESQGKEMKYLKLEFSEESEMTRFRRVFDTLYLETISRPLDRVTIWQQGTSQQRPESILSSSPKGTVYSMSPESHMRLQPSYDDGR